MKIKVFLVILLVATTSFARESLQRNRARNPRPQEVQALAGKLMRVPGLFNQDQRTARALITCARDSYMFGYFSKSARYFESQEYRSLSSDEKSSVLQMVRAAAKQQCSR